MALQLSVLGAPVIERDGRRVALDAPEAVALLAYLGVTARPHGRDALAAFCWPGVDRRRAAAALDRTLAAIRDAAGDVVRDDDGAVAVDAGTISIDERRARRLLAELRGHGHAAAAVCPDCIGALDEIARLHRGRFLDGIVLPDSPAYDDWRLATGEQLGHELSNVLGRLVDAHVLAGTLDRAVEVAQRRLTLDPLCEEAHRDLMRLHAELGRPRAALRQYRRCVHALRTELGVGPLAQTTRLYEDLVAQQGGGARAAERRPGEPERSDRTPVRHVRHRRPPLIAREHELAMANDTIARVGRDGVALIVEGEAGSGKTRMLEELTVQATRDGRRVLSAACRPGATARPYGAVRALLRPALGADPATCPWLAELRPDVVRELARVLPEVGVLAGVPPPAVGHGVRWRLVDALAGALAAAASAPLGERLPGVAVIDDVQWIDESSLAVVSHLADRLQGRPVCLLLAWRTELVGRNHRLRRLVSTLARRQLVRQLPLDRLGPTAVRMLHADLLGADWGELAALSESIMEATEGVPQQVLDYLGTLVEDPAGLRAPVPGGAHLLARRLSRVDPVASQVLTAAAGIGEGFDADLVRRVSGRTADETRAALAELLAAGLVTAGCDDGLYDIAEERLRALITDATDPVRRRLLHRRVAAALDARGTARREPARAGVVAWHHAQAGDPAAAATWYVRAGAHATRMLAVPEAVACYERALALGHAHPEHIHEALGDLLLLEGDYDAAVDRYHAAAAHAVHAALPPLEHKIAGVHLRMGRWPLAHEHLTVALSALDQGASGSRALEARILTDLGLVAQRRGHAAAAAAAAQAALRAAQEAADPGALAGAHNLLGVLGRRNLPAARDHLERALALARMLRDADMEITVADNLAQAYAADGALALAVPLSETALARAGQLGDRHREATLHNRLAGLLRSAGRNAEAMAHLRRAVALFAEIDDPDGPAPEAGKLAAW